MQIKNRNPEKIARIATLCTLSFMVCWGLAMVILEIKPFWIDEWRVIYNLKYKDAAMLWGPLDFLQQFPRVYIEVIKFFTGSFHYSYTALRLPSFLVGSLVIWFCYRLMLKIYKPGHFNRFLFIMILVSASTFTDYFVQIKQYTMDLLLSLVAIWQYLELMKSTGSGRQGRGRYLLLCASLLVVPFFSYTYPIAIAPVFIIQGIRSIQLLKNESISGKAGILRRQWLPLLLSAAGILVFYKLDVIQLMSDSGMHQFWGHLMMDGGFKWSSFFNGFYNLFAEVGSGMLYWYLFGILGSLSFIAGIITVLKHIRDDKNSIRNDAVLYSVLLLLVVIALFIAGKFPLGEPRLNAFTIPAISVLMINFLDQLKTRQKAVANTLSVVLYVGLIGNIYTTFYASISGPEYARKMEIYRSTQKAILLAQSQNIPALITPGIAWPYDTTQNLPFKNTVPGDWVLKTFPAYNVGEHIPVYAIRDLASLAEELRRLPPGIKSVIAGDGRYFRIIRR
jgi:hypothetical protein